MRTSRFPALTAAAAALLAAGVAAAGPDLAANEIVERNAVARGGLEAWRKVETMVWTGNAESAARPGQRASFVLEQKRPGKTRFEVTAAGQPAVRAFDGTGGWKMRLGGSGRPEVQPFTADEVAFARGAPVIEGPLMQLAARGARVALAGLQEVDGRKAYALDLRLPDGTASRLWVDAETFLELRHDREFVNAQGRPSATSLYFSDYRPVEGLRLPFTIETGTSDGRSRDRLVIERVSLNAPLDDHRFANPQSAGPRRRGVTVDTRSAAQTAPDRPAP